MNEWPFSYVGSDQLAELVRPRDAVAAIIDALRHGLEPGDDPPRTVLDLPSGSGQLLTMPAASHSAVGVKVITGAPANPARGLPRIHGVHLHFEPTTLQPVAAVDGAALTALRTPAVSVAATLPLLRQRGHPMRVVAYGAGPQGVGHVTTLHDVGCLLADVTYVVRDPSRVDATRLGGAGIVTPPAADRLLPEADIVICATTSQVPVFDPRKLAHAPVVLAVGSHTPDSREVDAAFVGRAQVVVEDVATALRECGDVIMAIDDGAISESDLIPMTEVVREEIVLDDSRPVLFKGSGMAWQDLVVADAAVRRLRAAR